MKQTAIEIRHIDESLVGPLAAFFQALGDEGGDKHFHPHPLVADEAARLAHYSGQDLYYVLVEGNQVLGYGMLRGWDEGYAIPSLGIAIHPAARGAGLGRLLMHFLHAAAHRKGALKIRLKVYPENVAALALYKSLGYVFQSQEAGQWVGLLDL